MPIRGSQQVAEALKMLGVNLPAPAPMPDMQPGMPGYDPTTLANKIDNPSVMDPTWLNLLRTGQNTLERVGQMGKGLLTGGSETPGPSAENLGAILGAIGPLLGKIVYHGSPHVFDKFDMSKIGTGEGAQAYGHGLYLADDVGVAKSYRDTLSKGDQLTVRTGKDVLAGDAIDDIGLDAIKFLEIGAKDAGQFPHNKAYYAKQYADRAAAGLPGAAKRNEAVKARIDAWKDAKIGYEKIRGSLYDVDLPDDAIAKMLDWDAPLSQQPEAVRKALADNFYLDPSRDGHLTGEDIYHYVASQTQGTGGPWTKFGGSNTQAAGSRALRSIGIPGVKYFDGVSRSAKDGTRNYVVFDDQLPKIVKVTR